ncbi:MAG: LysR substrate-binding domain-containing protein [Pseudomonadota bacterium]
MALRYTLRQLEYFVAVGEAGTIALASQRLNVSSPSISAAISQLEQEFGLQLFVRHHAQGLHLTPGGRRMFNAAQKILDDALALNDLASDIIQRPRGRLTVGALSTVAPMVSAALRRSFQDAYPEANVSLREGSQLDLLRMLSRAEIDVAITYDLEIPKDISFDALTALPPYVMLAADHPLAENDALTLQDLAEEPMVLLDIPLSREYFLSIFQSAGLRPAIAERTAQMSVARSLVANGFGFGLINMRMPTQLAPDGAHLALLPLSDDVRPMILGLALKRTSHRTQIVQAFCDHVRAQVTSGVVPGIGSR